ncbi:MAG TPA: hypothetical protein VGK54_16260, partial [Chloroflexota bacterium]
MSWETLIYWMTHVQEGSWATFRGAVARLAGDDADLDTISRGLRVFLSDFGHADFFIGGSQRWRVLPPVLGGLISPAGSAVTTGGRSPKLMADLVEGVAAHGCRVVSDAGDHRPALIRIDGEQPGLAAAAAVAGVPYVDQFADVVCGSIDPLTR